MSVQCQVSQVAGSLSRYIFMPWFHADVTSGFSCQPQSRAEWKTRTANPKGNLHILVFISSATLFSDGKVPRPEFQAPSIARTLPMLVRVVKGLHSKGKIMMRQVISGCLFHSQRFLSQDEIETKFSIPSWQVRKDEYIRRNRNVVYTCSRAPGLLDNLWKLTYKIW